MEVWWEYCTAGVGLCCLLEVGCGCRTARVDLDRVVLCKYGVGYKVGVDLDWVVL